MTCDLVIEGFLDEFDFAVVRIVEPKGEPRAVAFMRGNPIPLVLIEDGVRELVEDAGFALDDPLPGERLWLVATPVFAGDAEVTVIDEAEDEFDVAMGPTRTGTDPEGEAWVMGHPDLFRALYDAVRGRLEADRSSLSDLGACPAGENVIVRYRAVLAAKDADEAARLAEEPLIIAVLDAVGRRGKRSYVVLEDAMVEAEDHARTGAMNRELTIATTIPADRSTSCVWVWSRTLGRGVFRDMADWMIEPRLIWFSVLSATPEADPNYDEWACEHGMARALGGGAGGDAAEPDAAEDGSEAADLADLPPLCVLIAEDAEGETRCGPTTIQEAHLPSLGEAVRPSAAQAAIMRTMASLAEQTYQNFHAVRVPEGAAVGAAAPDDGCWRVVVGAGDVLEPSALERLAREASREGVWLVYADEDVLSLADGEPALRSARLKPPFSPDELYWGNGVGLPIAVSPELKAPEACSAYELALAAFEAGGAKGVRKIDGVLLHASHVRPFATPASVRGLQRHLDARGLGAQVSYVETNVDDDPSRAPGGILRVRYLRPDPCPLVSIVIPNRDQAGYLGPCVESILELTEWPNYEIVIVENGSVEDATLALYAELQERDPRVRVVSWTGRSFNYSAVINRGASKARGAYLCLLNNDTKVLAGEWLDELVGPLTRDEVGVTGALLTFADGLVQHAGVAGVPTGGFGHMQQNLWPGDPGDPPFVGADGYLMSLKRPMAHTMVTGACQAMRHELFDELGGYDEALAVGFNDGDFCMRARAAGYGTLFVPGARLWHKEFGTRHRESDNAEDTARGADEQALMHERYPELFRRDPIFNEALDPDSRYFRLDEPYVFPEVEA